MWFYISNFSLIYVTHQIILVKYIKYILDLDLGYVNLDLMILF